MIEQLADAMVTHGIPEYIRSDNGFCESFNGTFRDNLLDGKLFYSLKEARVVVGQWVKHYNHVRPHSSLGYRLPAPQTQVPKLIHYQPIMIQ